LEKIEYDLASGFSLAVAFEKTKVFPHLVLNMLKVGEKSSGLEKIKIRNIDVIVSDREKTLVDLIYLPQSVGGLKVAFEILKEQIKDTRVDVEKFVKYALKFPSVSTRKRIGYVLEQAGLKDQELKPLLNGIKRSSLVTLYPSKSRKGKINKKWMVIENAP
jgi:predicted transcriptional regulator of viral defense system